MKTCPVTPTHRGEPIEYPCGCSSFSCEECDLTHGCSSPACPLRNGESLGHLHPALTAMHAL